jgi:enoyl-CoA hydratase
MSHILMERVENIVIITIAREEKRNSFNYEVVDQLNRALAKVDSDRGIRAVILTGKGDRSFCAGGDLESFQKELYEDVKDGFLLAWEMHQAMERLSKPIVAAVNGVAAAGGILLVLYSDMAIASNKASFLVPDARLGVLPIFKFCPKLARAVGMLRAKEILMTGRTIDAVEAERIGLVNRVVPHDHLMGESFALARQLARNAPLVLSFVKDALEKCFVLGDEAYMEYEKQSFIKAWQSEDKKEGVRAFRERRTPQFKGK